MLNLISDLDENNLKSSYGTRKKKIDFSTIGQKKSLCGSECHACKKTMNNKESYHCKFSYEKELQSIPKSYKKSTCSKKFCFECLEKSFPEFFINKDNKDWKCPCCSGECKCHQCIKSNSKKIVISNQILDNEKHKEINNNFDSAVNNGFNDIKLNIEFTGYFSNLPPSQNVSQKIILE